MTGDDVFSVSADSPSPSSDLHVTMDESSYECEQVLEEEEDGIEHESDGGQVLVMEHNEQVLTIVSNGIGDGGDQVVKSGRNEQGSNQTLEIQANSGDNKRDNIASVDENGLLQAEGYPPPVTGMEFESYDDAYNYYNSYAKELGFGIRVKSSWTKRNSKEKRGAVLCCNCEGFKVAKEASSKRKETRTGCQAMIRLRLVESNRWRVDESKLAHNHSFDPQRAQNSKSHKRMDNRAKRKSEEALDVEVRTIKLYRTPVLDSLAHGSSREGETDNPSDRSKRLNLRKGDAQVLHQYFSHVQLTNPNFFYVMDFNIEGFLRHVFWIDPRARAVYAYFGDVICVDTTCLSKKYEIPLLSFLGVNHHGQSILLGCALLADDTQETYIWLLRVWLTCMMGRPPQTIITCRCKHLETAIAEVFPRARHHYPLTLVINHIVENLGELQDSEAFGTALSRTLYNFNKVDEFEGAWEEMTQRFGIKDHDWLLTLYEDREKWAPVYSKDTFFASIFTTSLRGGTISSFFDGYVHKQTSLKEFFDMYELVLQKKYEKEALDDFESKKSTPQLKTSHPYELQLSKVYTNEIFLKFQDEVEMMRSCLSVTQVHVSGLIITYMVKEREGEENLSGIKNFEVMYDGEGIEVRCLCGCFNLKGYLCRHALCVLNSNNVEEIPVEYILSRWRKDLKRLYVPNVGSDCIDTSNTMQWFDHLYKQAMQVAKEGMRSQEHYTVAWQAFKESLNKVRLVGDKHV